MDELHWYLKEDLDEIGDITSDALFEDQQAHAEIITNDNCILAGLEEAIQLFHEQKCKVEKYASDGEEITKNSVILRIQGNARSILKIERLALNILGRMSGIATETHDAVTICNNINKNVSITATRKTTPGFRKFEKKAVKIGGGETHRYGLYDSILIKDNHLFLTGSIQKAILTIKKKHPNKPIEIEVDTYQDAIKAAKLHADIIMLDNFTPNNAKNTSKEIKKSYPSAIIECSGGITKKNITRYAEFADRISLGSLTHSIKSKDFSMNFIR
jgi:nicotinate-nucleotide pyrophosphorylase (carboxylating)